MTGKPLVLVLPALALLPAACGTVDTSSMPQAPSAPASLSAGPPPPYRIQAGDRLAIRVPLSPELNDEVTVRPDGGISTTLDPDEHAGGRTVPELEAALDRAYTSELVDPAISVVVTQATPLRVWVAGAVVNPGEVRSADGRLTLSQAIAGAGGVKLAGDAARVFILRRDAGNAPHFLATHYADVADGHDPRADITLASGDVVIVPKSAIALGYQYFNQYVQEFVPVSWGFSYVLNQSAHTTVTQPTASP